MKAKLIKHILVKANEGKYFLFKEDETEFRIQVCEKLSLKNCQAIERGYDLDELAYIEVSGDTHRDDFFRNFFKLGFQKALEILGNKKFSEEDMISAFHDGWYCKSESKLDGKEHFIQSLQQTEWDVEVEMEDVMTFASMPKEGEKRVYQQPKLDADNCLILKRK